MKRKGDITLQYDEKRRKEKKDITVKKKVVSVDRTVRHFLRT